MAAIIPGVYEIVFTLRSALNGSATDGLNNAPS